MPTNVSNPILQATDFTPAVILAAGDTFNLLPTGIVLAYGNSSHGVLASGGSNVFNITGMITSTNGYGITTGAGGNSFALATNATVFGLFGGIDVTGGFNTFVNVGSIGARDAAVHFRSGGTTFNNSGNIVSASSDAVVIDGGSNAITNSGLISGSGSLLGDGLLVFGTNNSVVNSGTITGGVGISFNGGTGLDALFNTGSLIGRLNFGYEGSNAQDNIVNNGLIQGQGVAINLLAGNDVYDGRGGTLVGAVLGGNGNDTIYGGLGAEDLQGGNDNDQIFGGGGGDTINGDAGNDTIAGGAGSDVIRGGLGADTFVFNVGDQGDLIRSLNEGGVKDVFDLRGFFDATGFAGADPRAAGIMKVLQNGADTDVFLYGGFAFRIEGVVAAAIDNSYFLIP